MHDIKKAAIIILVQLIFFALFILYFFHNSFLRPDCGETIELSLALMLVIAMALNYWFLYPYVYKRHSFWMYVIATIAESAMVAILEYHLTIDAILQQLPPEAIIPDASSVKLALFINCFFRDTCLLGFSGVMANNMGQKFRILETDNLMLKRKKQIIVQLNGDDHIVNAESICYVQQRQNYTYIFSNNGLKYERRGALSFFEGAPECLHPVKISRSTIVFLPYVLSLNEKEVTVIIMDNPYTVIGLPFGNTMVHAASLKIKQYLQQKGDNEEDDSVWSKEGRGTESAEEARDVQLFADVDMVGQKQNDSDGKRKEGKKFILIRDYICQHQDCNIKDIVSGTKTPKSTVTRYLKELQRQGIVKYVGSKKTGGYRVVEE